MQNKFCPSCGNKTSYEFEAPKKCPSCNLEYTSAFKKKIAEIEPTVVAAKKKEIIEEDEDSEYETIRIKKKKKSAATKTTKELEAEEFSDDNVDLDEVEASAQEIAASLNENDLMINYGTDEPLKLGDLFPKQQ
jgi:hypothetical protein